MTSEVERTFSMDMDALRIAPPWSIGAWSCDAE
jgi:hypothetical protein